MSVAFSKREWVKRRFYAISDAEGVKSQNRKIPADLEKSHPRSFSPERFLQGGKKATEVPFKSASLRIRGRLDFVSIADEEVTVSDFKSGKVIDLEGNVNDETSRQLRLYALAIAELAPKKKVVLRVVSRGREFAEHFGEETKIETLKWLAGITDVLKVGEQMSATELAVIGPQCARCDIRPICPAYLDAMGELWKRGDTPFTLPLDTAGTVMDVREQGEHSSIKIFDRGGRVVKIHRLSRERARGVSTDQTLWVFDLASIEAKMQATGWRHPRNFHEVAMLPTERTAWIMRAFSSRLNP